MADELRIVRQDEELTYGENGKVVEQIRVQFRVGDHGPFWKRFPKDGYNAVTARAELEAFAREVRGLSS